jgi:hypothetical protein
MARLKPRPFKTVYEAAALFQNNEPSGAKPETSAIGVP